MSLSRIKAAVAHDDAALARLRGTDTIPAPPPSDDRPTDPNLADEEAPASRFVDSNRRRDTTPAPPPDGESGEDEAPVTERMVSNAG